jgi:hypothetical protein
MSLNIVPFHIFELNREVKNIDNFSLRRLNRQLKPRLIPFKILPRMESPSLRRNHKKNLGSAGLIWRYDFFKFNMVSYGNNYGLGV